MVKKKDIDDLRSAGWLMSGEAFDYLRELGATITKQDFLLMRQNRVGPEFRKVENRAFYHINNLKVWFGVTCRAGRVQEELIRSFLNKTSKELSSVRGRAPEQTVVWVCILKDLFDDALSCLDSVDRSGRLTKRALETSLMKASLSIQWFIDEIQECEKRKKDGK